MKYSITYASDSIDDINAAAAAIGLATGKGPDDFPVHFDIAIYRILDSMRDGIIAEFITEEDRAMMPSNLRRLALELESGQVTQFMPEGE